MPNTALLKSGITILRSEKSPENSENGYDSDKTQKSKSPLHIAGGKYETKYVALLKNIQKSEPKQGPIQLLKVSKTPVVAASKAQVPKSPSMRLSPPFDQSHPANNIKYLGLVIERAEEEETPEDDPIERVYLPIREKYIRIVKCCRQKIIASHHRLGTKDLVRRARHLIKVAKQIRMMKYI